MDLLFWAPVMCAGLVAGASTGLLGSYIVGMRIPFLGICVRPRGAGRRRVRRAGRDDRARAADPALLAAAVCRRCWSALSTRRRSAPTSTSCWASCSR